MSTRRKTHLTLEERCRIFGLKASGFSLRKISTKLAVNVSTISREVSRNSSQGAYNPTIAHQISKNRRSDCNIGRFRSMTPMVRIRVKR